MYGDFVAVDQFVSAEIGDLSPVRVEVVELEFAFRFELEARLQRFDILAEAEARDEGLACRVADHQQHMVEAHAAIQRFQHHGANTPHVDRRHV